jgi:hypothetical protein
MPKTPKTRQSIARASVQRAFRENRKPDRTRKAQAPFVRPTTSRLMKGNTVVMSKTNQEAENDLSLDIAETVGKTVGNIVNRIEALDKERAELVKKLADARTSLNEQFNKWIPESIVAVGAKVKSKGKREVKPGTSCSICGFATDPPHDGRLKVHRDQGKNKRALTDNQIAAADLTRL